MARKPSMADAIMPPGPPPIPTSPTVPIVQVTKLPAARPPSRVGRKGVAFWIDPAAARQFALWPRRRTALRRA